MKTIVKIGGSVFTDKSLREPVWFWEDDFGDDFCADVICDIFSNFGDEIQAVVFGAGSFGHPAADELGLTVDEFREVNALHLNELNENLSELENVFIRPLLSEAWQNKIFFPKLEVRNTEFEHLKMARIISGDDIVADLVTKHEASRVVFYTDQPLVIDDKIIDNFHSSDINQLVATMGMKDVNRVDVTGGLSRKLSLLADRDLAVEVRVPIGL